MPLLDASGVIVDRWVRPTEGAGSVDADTILSFAGLAVDGETVLARGHRLGVEIAADVRIDALRPLLPRLALVAIAFKSFTDGRGFSLARQLRLAGFAGELRAVGALIADQFAFLRSCGFDTVELDAATLERQPAEQWAAALEAFSRSYQRSYGGPLNILAARRHAREATDRAAAE